MYISCLFLWTILLITRFFNLLLWLHLCLCPELKQFRENNGGSPEYTINMCFGERFPDGKALEKKLITVKVTVHLFLLSLSLKTHTGFLVSSLPLSSFFMYCKMCFFAHVGGPPDMSTLSWTCPYGGSFISSQRQRQPTDLTQQPLWSHQLCFWTADGRGCFAFSTTDLKFYF